MYRSITQGIAACHLKCHARISVRDKVYKNLSATLYPKVSVCNSAASHLDKNIGQRQSIIRSVSYAVTGYSFLSPGEHIGISVSNKVYEYQSATLLPSILACNLGCSGLSHVVHTRISVSNKVYEYLSATLLPIILVCNLGYSPLSAGLGGPVGCALRLETRRSRVQPPPRSATFFRGDWSWNIFYGHSPPSADSRRAVVSFWRKNVHNTGSPLRGLSLPSKRVVR